MDQAQGDHHYFQQYSFLSNEYQHFGGLFQKIAQAAHPLPAILTWFQMSEAGSTESIKIKRRISSSGQSFQYHYRILEPGSESFGDVESNIDVMSLSETLLTRGLSPFTNAPLVFFDPFLYKRKFCLQPTGRDIQLSPDWVKKTWLTHFFWRAGVARFVSGTASDAANINMKVIAEYKKHRLKSYRIELTGLPDLVFEHVIPNDEEPDRKSVKPKSEQQFLRERSWHPGRLNLKTGQPDLGYHSIGPYQSILGTNVMTSITTGLNIRLEQAFMQLPGSGAIQ